jgi:hypothetical protein
LHQRSTNSSAKCYISRQNEPTALRESFVLKPFALISNDYFCATTTIRLCSNFRLSTRALPRVVHQCPYEMMIILGNFGAFDHAGDGERGLALSEWTNEDDCLSF